MTDALTAAPLAPQTDTLQEQTDLPNPQTNTIPEDDTPPSEKRSGAISKALDDVLGADDEKPKVEAKAKPEPKKELVKAESKPPAAEKSVVQTEATAEPVTPKRPTAYRDAPAGFDEGAKAEWEAVPESVRGAMHRRHQELEQGIQKYRTEVQEFEPVRKYAELAKQSGTTLDQALERYVNLETKLRQDPVGGLEAVVANLGLKKSDGTQVTLRDVAASIMGQTPSQTATRQDATIQRLTQQLAEVNQRLSEVSQHVETQKHDARVKSLTSEWDSFVSQNPRAAELTDPIAEFLTKYQPDDNLSVNDRLQDAYAWAVARHPSVAHTDEEPLVQTQTPTTPNPAGQKSISGSPGTSDAKSVPRNLNRSAAIEKAMRQAGL